MPASATEESAEPVEKQYRRGSCPIASRKRPCSGRHRHLKRTINTVCQSGYGIEGDTSPRVCVVQISERPVEAQITEAMDFWCW